jgi:hypothetical protein
MECSHPPLRLISPFAKLTADVIPNWREAAVGNLFFRGYVPIRGDHEIFRYPLRML